MLVMKMKTIRERQGHVEIFPHIFKKLKKLDSDHYQWNAVSKVTDEFILTWPLLVNDKYWGKKKKSHLWIFNYNIHTPKILPKVFLVFVGFFMKKKDEKKKSQSGECKHQFKKYQSFFKSLAIMRKIRIKWGSGGGGSSNYNNYNNNNEMR